MRHQRWTEDEMLRLKELREAMDLTFDKIAEILDRTPDSVRHKYNRTYGEEHIEFEDDGIMDLYNILRSGPKSLLELCYLMDNSPQEIQQLVQVLEGEGVKINTHDQHISMDRSTPVRSPKISPLTRGKQELKIAFFSDTHAGSIYAQPTSLNVFLKTAYDEGVRHFFFPGDVVDGVGGVSDVQEEQLVECNIRYTRNPIIAVQNQVMAANVYIPKMDGAHYYMLGGNHDEWSIKKYGIDPVRMLCDMREDMHYVGYYQSDIPLTDRITIRLVHPKGGVPYAKSHRAQKNMENVSIQSLVKDMEENKLPSVYIVALGHIHIVDFAFHGPYYGISVPCFMGSSLFMKRSALNPSIGGIIQTITLDNDGLPHRVSMEYVSFAEIEDDYKEWDVPFDTGTMDFRPDPLKVIYSLN